MKYLIILLSLVSLGMPVIMAQENKTILTATNFENIPYPFPVQFIQLNIQGEPLKMAYMDAQSPKPNGKTVLLLHGKNFCSAYWEQTAKELVADGYRVIMPDQIGFGKSSKPAKIQYSFQLLAGNTKAVLDSLGIEQVSLLGHSMGGMLATRFALMYPERVAQLVLENPIGLEDWKTVVPYQRVEDWYSSELKQTRQSMKQYQLKSYYDNQWKPDYDRWLDMMAGLTLNIDYPRIAWNSALLYDMIFTQPVCYEFQQLKMPVLLIIGQRDRTALGKDRAPKALQDNLGNYPALGKETAAKIKNAQLVELDGVGHLPHIEAYARFISPLKRFLKR